ncbi:MAG: ABC transporter ATP-binding protein [Desulfobacteraceae bacterium]|nr:MAG: ABC transporter ATP-binding protein [Desulfobacteraceae bacterium]
MIFKIDTKLYKRILGYSKPYIGLIALGMILASVFSAMNGASAWLVQPVLDDIFLKKNMTMLKLLPLAVILVYLVKGAAGYAQSCIMKSVGERIITKLRYELYEHINRMSMSFFERIPSAVLMARITNDVRNLSSVSSKVIADFARESTTLLALMVVLFWRDYKLASISILVVPLSAIPMVKIGQRLRKLSRKRQEKIAQINNLLQETFIGTKIVKAFCMEDAENIKFNILNRQFYRLIMKSVRADEITSPLIEFLGSACLAVIILYGGYQVVTGSTTPGTFFSFLAALFLMYKPIRIFSKMNNTVQDAMASAERVFSILDTPQDIKDDENATGLKGFNKKIEFKNVSFQYNEKDGPVLQNINLDIVKGETVALVGMSGAGKSTLVNLIPRFYDVTSGGIFIDGIDIRKCTVRSLRENIGIVTQESILFNESVRYNIAYGRQDCSDEEIVQAATDAYAHDFIMQLPQRYDSIIGERGCRLSGGQRQRTAIARALLRNPDILILDEATSDLDTESEYYVQKALENLMKTRTTLVIAHRLSTVMNSDRILVFDDGRIIDSGRHENLIKKDGIYKNLFERQFKNDVNGTQDTGMSSSVKIL